MVISGRIWGGEGQEKRDEEEREGGCGGKGERCDEIEQTGEIATAARTDGQLWRLKFIHSSSPSS